MTGTDLEFRVQDVRVDPRSARVWRADVEIALSPMEYRLLLTLISRAGTTVSRAELMLLVWETDFYTSTKTIDVHVGWLRRKLGDDPRRPQLISTLRGRGLRFEVTTPVR
ncbi:Alkaline phosphatase synthesis transcriptional regulatory protein PhoP (fragment) [metagenome]|uniref:Alkaline phosphatase synthesis transcriptional regulatory protein PhoP n=1 Tax=metagenome TaxID=256318 RepID=A0A2P2C0V2_9ZZZZ